MLRYRRYRAFLAFAVIAIFGLYGFTRPGSWQKAQQLSTESLNKIGLGQTATTEEVQKANQNEEAAARHTPDPGLTPSVAATSSSSSTTTTSTTNSQSVPAWLTTSNLRLRPAETPAAPWPGQPGAARPMPVEEDVAELGEGRLEVTRVPDVSAIYWSSQPEHFPVATTIQLPSQTPVKIPRIQHKFEPETSAEKEDRMRKLDAVASAAAHAWKGYRDNAWLHDEVKPLSGGVSDPFCGWAATLVDGLDTLWIMGMKTEFKEAVDAVATIQFKTSTRNDIPLFETTIRYLGGLIAAYDISGAKYKVLLDKAVELAEILMGAFDTPNRMPMTYYHWMPAYASQPHRATTRVVLAEIGSLSVEFTRLAQLTKEPKYYDAIDRITDAFQEWQNRTEHGTLIPGLWPTYLDASGCEKPAQMRTLSNADQEPLAEGQPLTGPPVSVHRPNKLGDSATDETAADISGQGASKAAAADADSGASSVSGDAALSDGQPGVNKIKSWGNPMVEGSLDNMSAEEKDKLIEYNANSDRVASKHKRQLDGMVTADVQPESKNVAAPNKAAAADATSNVPHGMPSRGGPSRGSSHRGSSGGPRVSVPDPEICIPRGLESISNTATEHFTLGGMADSTYEYLPKEYLLLGGVETKYRTMYEKAADAATKYLIFRPMTPNNDDILFAGDYQTTRNADVKPKFNAEAAHLTCFAGGMYALGAKIFDREEDLDIAAKLTEGCVWAYANTQTGIMPEDMRVMACDSKTSCEWNQTLYYELLDPWRESRTRTAPMPDLIKVAKATETAKHIKPDNENVPVRPADDIQYVKRQMDSVAEAVEEKVGQNRQEQETPTPVQDADPATFAIKAPAYTPPPPLAHEEFVVKRIKEERLPPGVVKIKSRKYILRPEAIESVFYMYRITGDKHWREVGWNMFRAVQDHTVTEHGNSAIADVTSLAPDFQDQEESFWIAETLKYFYLLFAEEDVVSLDDWVFNTEAHMFKRPDASI